MKKRKFAIGILIKSGTALLTSLGIISLYILAYEVLLVVENEEQLYEKLIAYVYHVVVPFGFSFIWLFFNYQLWDIIFLKMKSKIIYFIACLFAILIIISGFVLFYTRENIDYWIRWLV